MQQMPGKSVKKLSTALDISKYLFSAGPGLNSAVK